MAENIADWYTTVHAFFDEDLQQLIGLGIPEADALVLLSEYLIIMMDRISLLRQNLMEFSMVDDQVDYQTRCLWVSLQVHQELDALATNGLCYNSSHWLRSFVSSLFRQAQMLLPVLAQSLTSWNPRSRSRGWS